MSSNTSEEARKRHLDSLKIFSEDLQEVEAGEEYHISITNGDSTLVLDVRLPWAFPNQQPIIHVTPVLMHWRVDDRGYVSLPADTDFIKGSDLGQIIRSIAHELKGAQCILQSSSGKRHQSLSGTFLTIPTFIPELECLSLQQLGDLDRDRDSLEQFVEDLPQVVCTDRDLLHCLDNLDHVARCVADQKDLLRSRKRELLSRYSTLDVLRQQWESLSQQHAVISQRYLPGGIEKKLRNEAERAEEHSEEVAEAFLSGSVDLDAFLADYTSLRMVSDNDVSHKRKTKEEMLHKQLEQLQRLGY